MCGLAGCAALGGASLGGDAEALLQRMTAAVSHRGPDGRAFHRSESVNLGFTRLSLVDPVGGGQPLSTDDGSLVLIANGEVYNHRELIAGLPTGTKMRTGSDCEVLLHLYRRDGLNFLDAVRGMFAVVLWDRNRNRLIFARDRFGIKPLYYHRNQERIIFASEIKALFEDPSCPREIDWLGALSDQMMTGAMVLDDSQPRSWFKEIELAPAASIVTIDLLTGDTKTHQYWSFPTFDGARTGSEAELIDRYRDALASSVAECGVADVEVGLFLSGGIDSAAVAAFAPEKPRTFTALNGSTLLNGDAEYGDRIARHVGLVNHQVLFDTTVTPSADEWKRLLWLLETPLAGPEAFYKYELYRYVGAYAPEIKAMLLGGGADEFNGGYSVSFAGGGDWTDFESNVRRMELRTAQWTRPDLGTWWEQSDRSLVRESVLRDAAGGTGRDAYDMLFRWKYRDVQQYNCWHEDRTAAGNGIEARVPFLDHRLVELVAAVPKQLRPALVWDKQILRRAMAGLLPQDVVNRPKVPFFYGDGVLHTYRTFVRMLAQNGGVLLDEALSGAGARQFLDADNIRTALHGLQQDPASGHVEFLLHAVNLGLLEQMTHSLPARPAEAVTAAVPESITVHDWDEQRSSIEEAVLQRPAIDDETVVGLADGALLLHSPDDPATWYVVVDGAIEYVIDEDDNPHWPALLRALGEETPLGVVRETLGITLAVARDLVVEGLESGVLTLSAEVVG
ncbi:asparagine synthase [Actinoplanes sp. SE50]|nr:MULTISPECIES: asparagine synthase (glutamine-hydrolyzing) [unclassified Actinoplanes]AEV87120.1 asparagine synthase (glutamine-hydrolysing) [Actinoplanes sp. SE50/110]ATO85518.1 asparagine synthase [Actinoplanes sp. SE50]SLM02930.1 asparagine synthetase B [Actinoplanes sp. SE50/110]